MSVFINNNITDRGRILLAAAQTGAVFEATRIVMGAGFMPSGATARTMTAVVLPVVELQINKKKLSGDGKVTFGGMYTNETITEAFYFREFALYARVKYPATDASEESYSDEVLYSYGNAGDSADLMPAHGSGTAIEKQMDIVTWVGNDIQIDLTVESGMYITPDNITMYLDEYAKKQWVLDRIDERIETIVIPLIGDFELLQRRVEQAEYRVDSAEQEIEGLNVDITAMKANDTQIHAHLNEVAAQASAVWDAVFNDITENPAIVDFDTLDGITLNGGTWNQPLRRLEV